MNVEEMYYSTAVSPGTFQISEHTTLKKEGGEPNQKPCQKITADIVWRKTKKSHKISRISSILGRLNDLAEIHHRGEYAHVQLWDIGDDLGPINTNPYEHTRPSLHLFLC